MPFGSLVVSKSLLLPFTLFLLMNSVFCLYVRPMQLGKTHDITVLRNSGVTALIWAGLTRASPITMEFLKLINWKFILSAQRNCHRSMLSRNTEVNITRTNDVNGERCLWEAGLRRESSIVAGFSFVVDTQQLFSWTSVSPYFLNLGHTEHSGIHTLTFKRWNLKHESFYILSSMPISSRTGTYKLQSQAKLACH